MQAISAYIPCYNAAHTVADAIESLTNQTVAVDDLVLVDDGSSDGSAGMAEAMGVKVVRLETHRGRGAARHAAMLHSRHDLVVCLDANKTIERDFLEHALPAMMDDRVAAVFGCLTQPQATDVVSRWRGRHLYKADADKSVAHGSSLITASALVRKSAVISVGNYNPQLQHSEDRELGERLLSAGFDVIRDPQLLVTASETNSLGQVLERYWRWHAGADESVSLPAYLGQISYSMTVMIPQDLQAGDPLAAGISLISPHYQFWRSAMNRTKGASQS